MDSGSERQESFAPVLSRFLSFSLSLSLSDFVRFATQRVKGDVKEGVDKQ